MDPISSKEPVLVSEQVGGALNDSGQSTSVHKGEEGSREGCMKDTTQNDNDGLVYEDGDTQKGGCKVHDSEVVLWTSVFHTKLLL